MADLLTVNKSPFEKNSLETAIKYSTAGSAILLIEDGVYGAMKGSRAESMMGSCTGICWRVMRTFAIPVRTPGRIASSRSCANVGTPPERRCIRRTGEVIRDVQGNSTGRRAGQISRRAGRYCRYGVAFGSPAATRWQHRLPHEMRDNVYEEYVQTVHYNNRTGVRATCPDCHVPKEWIYKVKRKIQATNELYHKALGSIDTREKFEAKRLELARHVWDAMKETDSRECRNCHGCVLQFPGAAQREVVIGMRSDCAVNVWLIRRSSE